MYTARYSEELPNRKLTVKLSSSRDLFIKYGFKIVQNPAAFDLIGPNTCLISPYVRIQILAPLLLGKPIENLAMFVGDGGSMLQDAQSKS